MGWQDAPEVAPAAAQPAWAAAPEVAPQQSLGEYVKQGIMGVPAALAGDIETGYRMAQGAVQAIPAGLAGIAQGAYNVGAEALGGRPGMPAANRIEQVQQYGAQPLTQVARQNLQTIGGAVRPVVEAARAPGMAIAEAGYPMLGTIVGAAPEAALTMIDPAARGAMGSMVRGAERGAPAAAAATANAATAAEQFANTQLQTPWAQLPDTIKSTLTKIAAEGKDLTKLDAKAIDRQAQLARVGITKASKGQLTRDPLQQRREQLVRASEVGNDLRQADIENNRILAQNVQDLAKGLTGKSKLEVGQSVQGVLRARMAQAKKAVSAAYKAAKDAGELQGTVESQPFLDYLNTHGDPEFVNFAGNKLKAIGAAVEKDGKLVSVRPVTLEEMETLYKSASARQKAGGTQGFYAKELKDQINAVTEGAGGDAYKAARSMRNKMGEEFERTQAVAQLVRNRKMSTDRATKLEDTWRKTVVNGGAEDLLNVQKSLIKGGKKGVDAWNDLRGATADYILAKATGGGELGLKNAAGELQVSWDGLRRAVQEIGPEKLTMMYGKAGYKKLNDIVEAAQILKTEAPTGVKGSATVDKLITLMDKFGAVPVAGKVADVAGGAVKAVAKLASVGKEGREARAAMVTPLEETARKGQTLQSLKKRAGATTKAGAPTIAITRGSEAYRDQAQ
jgi:hypothetical protein